MPSCINEVCRFELCTFFPGFALIVPSHYTLAAVCCTDDKSDASACIQLTSEAESNPKTGLKILLKDPGVSA